MTGMVFELWLAGLAFAKLKPRALHYDLLHVLVEDR